jgi:Ca2+-binding EF-hand superfamily protein
MLLWTSAAASFRVSRGTEGPDKKDYDPAGDDEDYVKGKDYDPAGDDEDYVKGKDYDPDTGYNPMCDDPDDPDYNPSDPKCTGFDWDSCDDPGHADYDPEHPMCTGEMDDVVGNGEDNMAEEIGDYDDGPSFNEIDTSGDGFIDMNEAVTYATVNGIPASEVQTIFEHLDKDEDGLVSEAEFESDKAEEISEDMAPTHSDLDLNGDGFLEWEEWEVACVCGKSYLDTCADESMCKDIFDASDGDGDGKLTKAEFDSGGDECKTADDGNCDLLASKNPSKVHGITIRKLLKVKKSGHSIFTLAKQRARKFKKANHRIKKVSKQHQRKQVSKKHGHRQQRRHHRSPVKRSHLRG